MTDKEKYTAVLMDAVGKIDDRFVYEAQNYIPKKRVPGYVKAIIAAAASFILIIGVTLPGLFIALTRIAGNSTAVKSDLTAAQRLSTSLIEASAAEYESVPKNIGAALIWQTDPEGKYSVLPISGDKAEAVISSIGKGGAPASEDDGVRIWIRTENGEYVSPELKYSPGNTECAVFGYMPEITVSDNAAYLIGKILKERKNKA